jgi:hypothetical protein
LILGQQVKSAGESVSKFRMACQNTIIFLGADKCLAESKLSNVPPWLPDRQYIREMYLKDLTTLDILQTAELQHAEKDGTIDRLMSQVHTQMTVERMAEIVKALFEKGGLTSEQKATVKKSAEVAEGMYRRPFQ